MKLSGSNEALTWFDKALALRPDVVGTLSSRATALSQIRRFDEAIAAYAYVKNLDPENAGVDLSLGHLHLSRGNFEEGWTGYEARLRLPDFNSYPKFSQPMWRGEDGVAGKTMLICADEGLGDQIQFARFVPLVAALGVRIILVVQPSVQELLSTLPGVSQCLPKVVGPLPSFDLHCPLKPANDGSCAGGDDIGSNAISIAAGREPRAGLGRPPWSAHRNACWPRMVRQSQPHQRSQSLSAIPSAVSDPRL